VGTEFVIVVAGVFVGLQAQDWSTARAERRAEHDAIERLIVEYKLNLELLDANNEKSQKTMAATERLLATISPDPDAVIADKALAQTILECLTNPKLFPTLGTTSSLMVSGDLRLIGDPEIQRMLTQWPTTAQVLIEQQQAHNARPDWRCRNRNKIRPDLLARQQTAARQDGFPLVQLFRRQTFGASIIGNAAIKRVGCLDVVQPVLLPFGYCRFAHQLLLLDKGEASTIPT